MTHPAHRRIAAANAIDAERQRVDQLVRRIHDAADEIASAARYGLPIPRIVSVSTYRTGGLQFCATPDEAAAWADYLEVEVQADEHHGSKWSKVNGDANGLPIEVVARHDSEGGAA